MKMPRVHEKEIAVLGHGSCPTRRFSSNLILLTGSLLCSFGLGELVFGMFPVEYPSVPAIMQLYGYHPKLGWTMRPSIVMDGHPVTNERGWRGEPVRYSRGLKRRILVLGDSFAFGFGVSDSEALFSRKLEETLPDTEVVNLGVSGYSTLQELLLYKTEGVKYKPDIVILMFHVNDFYENTVAYSSGILGPIATIDEKGHIELPTSVLPIVQGWGDGWVSGDSFREKLYRSSNIYKRWQSLLVEGVRAESEVDPGNYERLFIPSACSKEGKVTIELLRALHQEVTRSGARFMVVTTPSATRVWAENWEEMKSKYSWDDSQKCMALEELFAPLESEGICVGHSSAEFIEREKQGERNYSRNHWHWNEDGHKVFSSILEGLLCKCFPVSMRRARP